MPTTRTVVSSPVSGGGNFSASLQLSKEERVLQLGVDCLDQLTWRKWTTGNEYSKTLEIQNRLPQSQVIEYSLPENKSTFFLEFPAPVTLAPGMIYPLEIKFRPTQRTSYRDRIQIRTKQGAFSVQLLALIPYADCVLDEAVDFGLCPVREEAEQQVTLRNTGTMPLQFTWQAMVPFCVTPAAGNLKLNQSLTVKITFHPQEASSFIATVVCQFSGEADGFQDSISRTLNLKGIGKYPYIHCKMPELDFGSVICGKEVTQTLALENRSPVCTQFAVRKVDADLEDCFTFAPTKGTIASGSTIHLRVTYQPVTTGTFSCDSYRIETLGGNAVSVRCSGQATGPELTISIRSLDFGDHPVGAVVEKAFRLTNHSWLPAQFQWLGVHPGCGFEFSPAYGSISACDKLHKGTQTCVVRFRPSEPMNYYRRCFCLIGNQSTLLYMDLLGSGFDEREKKRPAPFKQHHVNVYRARLEAGLAKATPEEIEHVLTSLQDETAFMEESESHMRDTLVTTMRTTHFSPPTTDQMWREVFTPSSDHMALPFSLDLAELSFGAATRSREGRVVHVRNNTAAKARAVWCLPSDSAVWAVQPMTADVGPFSSQEFHVVFKPNAADRFYHTTLECYVAFKTMRSFRLVNEDSFTPPTCLPLYVHGHTFPPLESFTPYAELSRSLISFPACHPSTAMYQTVMLFNRGEQAMHYSIIVEAAVSQLDEEQRRRRAAQEQSGTAWEEDLALDLSKTSMLDSSPVFSCHPAVGVVPVGGHQLIAFRYQPHAATQYRARAQCLLNEQSGNVLTLTLQGQSHNPQLLLPDDAVLTFKPTQVNGSSGRSYTIENPSRVPVTFTWQIPSRLQSIVSVEPNTGLLRGNERLKLRVTFRPSEEKKYLLRLPCQCSVVGLPADPKSTHRTALTVIGEGQIGGLTMEPPLLDFGDVRVGTSESRQLTLFNSTGCDIYFSLAYRASEATAAAAAPTVENDPLAFSTAAGMLPARAHMAVQVRFTPWQRADYRLVAYCRIGHTPGSTAETQPGSLSIGESGWTSDAEADLGVVPRCEVVGRGSYPALGIVDVRSVAVSRAHLWQQLHINDLNAVLAQDLTPSDTNRTQFSVQSMIAACPSFRMDFGAAPVDSPSVVVHLELANHVPMPVQFVVRFPDETDLNQELWWPVDAVSKSDSQLDTILYHQLFDVQPRSATINPGSTVTIQITSRHTLVGSHRLPVLLDIRDGKRVCLDLYARTLDVGEPHLQLLAPFHSLQPVAIGDTAAPLQYFELRNDSAEVVQYAVDLAPLAQLQAANYQFPVLQCQNPEGLIPASSSVWLRWLFTPLEAKLYTVEVPISINNGEAQYQVAFRAEGYHQKKVAAEAQMAMRSAEFSVLPEAPRLVLERLPLSLSLNVLRFGRVAQHSLSRRMVVLRNHSATATYSYLWTTTLPYGNAELKVQPSQGSLAPGQVQVFKLTFYAGSVTQILDLDVDCVVLDTTSRTPDRSSRSVHGLPRLADEEEAAEETFLAHRSPRSMARTLGNSYAAGATTMGAAVSVTQGQSQRKPRRPLAESQLPASARTIGPTSPMLRPEQPWDDHQPAFLGVRIQARVMSTEQFKESHMDQLPGAWFPSLTRQEHSVESPFPSRHPSQILGNRPASRGLAGAVLRAQVDGDTAAVTELQGQFASLLSGSLTSPPVPPLPSLPAAQAPLYSSLLADMLRDVVHDLDVVEAFESRHLDRVPYYCEMASTPKSDRVSLLLTRPPSSRALRTPISLRPDTVNTAVSFADPGLLLPPSGRGPGNNPSATIPVLENAELLSAEEEAPLLQAMAITHEAEREATERRRVLQDSEFQVLAEEALEALSFDILEEVARGRGSLVPASTMTRLRARKTATPPHSPLPTAA
eukprot:GGOE01002719.1.p1 GENE.GGOE01002719.1~~GGOE01002719.1.p1  ORF type:complete len:1874 (-),score=555.85 GGOE01002719.1:418-6039(-)